jgi:osmotically-inducible protein OsmY
MTRFKMFLMAAVSSAAFAAIAQGAEPATDAQITDQVIAKIQQDDPHLGRRVQVETHGGVVTLSGTAYTGQAALKALEDARSVDGVVKVQNRLSIQQ